MQEYVDILYKEESANLGSSLAWFHAIAEAPGKVLQQVLASGGRVWGCLPYYAPEELVYAAGYRPMAMWGASLRAKKAKAWLPPQFCSLVQTTLELAARGGYEGLSGILCGAICDPLRSFGQNWTAACRIPVLYFSQPQNRSSAAGKRFLAGEYRRVYEELCAARGEETSPEKVREAIRIYNESRRVRREFVRLAGVLRPSDRCAVLKAAGFADPAVYTEHLQRVNALLRSGSSEGDFGKSVNDLASFANDGIHTIPVITSGILCDHPRILELLDSYHYRIVGDDMAAESRSFAADAPEDGGDPFEALAERFANADLDTILYPGGSCCSGKAAPSAAAGDARAMALVHLAQETGARAVLLLRQQFCDPEEVLEPALREALDAAGIPCLPIPVDQQVKEPGQAVTLLETLADML